MKESWFEDGNVNICWNCQLISNKLIVTEVQDCKADYEYHMDDRDYRKVDENVKDIEERIIQCSRCYKTGLVFYSVNKYQSYFSECGHMIMKMPIW